MIQFRVLFLTAAAFVALALPGVAAPQPEKPININTATAEELTQLPRIGPVTAARIVEWREENGPFSSTEELLNVQGVGERTYERIEPHVTVEDSDRPRRGHLGPARPA